MIAISPELTNALNAVEPSRRDLASHLLAHIPSDGSPIGNKSLRRQTHTLRNSDYWTAAEQLVGAGVLVRGHGRGGSVRLAEVWIGRLGETPLPKHARFEHSLYGRTQEQLRLLFDSETKPFDDLVIEPTANQGGRDTGGVWTRPDVTIVGMRRHKVLAGVYVEVSTYELKTASALNAQALHEARAHLRAAHRAFVLVKVDDPRDQDTITGLIDYARDLGVGLLSCTTIDDDWDVWLTPAINLPDPIALDDFLATQLNEGHQQRIRGWHATPAPAGVE